MRKRALTCAVGLLAAGCQSYSVPIAKPDDQLDKAELNARGDELIRRGENRKLEGLNMSNGMYRRAGPNRIDVIRDGEDTVQHGQRLKAMAATRPD